MRILLARCMPLCTIVVKKWEEDFLVRPLRTNAMTSGDASVAILLTQDIATTAGASRATETL
jgi:hypothetical protein